MAWHRHSEYAHSGHKAPLSRDERVRWREMVRFGHKAGKITHGAKHVAAEMLACLGADGRLDPSQETLARLAAVGERTVRRALEQLRAAGLVEWACRIIRTRQGSRQTSNAYRLRIPGKATWPEPNGHRGRGTSKLRTTSEKAPQSDLSVMPANAREALDVAKRRLLERFAATQAAKRSAPPSPIGIRRG